MRSKFRILCIDGGGIRGIIPAMVLAEIERRTKKPICRLFDLIAGTSTGGILALGLTRPNPEDAPLPREEQRPQYEANDLVKLYETNGRRIFSSSLLHRILSLGNILDKKYPTGPVDQVLEEYFGDARLSQALTDVLIPSYEIERREAFFFKSQKARMPIHNDFLMREVARATSAAPTYFEPELVGNTVKEEENEPDFFALIDGGTYANNPSMCAVVEALRRFDRNLEDIFMVSIGTGEQKHPLQYQKVKGWGVLDWAQPILSVVFHGVSNTVDYQSNLILNVGPQKGYYRIQMPIDVKKDIYRLDDTRPATLRALKGMAKKLIADNEKELAAICEVLAPTRKARQRKTRVSLTTAARTRPKKASR